MRPILTIVIPSYNHSRYVLETIHSALEVRLTKQVIVIDDGSTDDSVSIIAKYIEGINDLNSIQFIARENRGLSNTLNEGLSLASGKYFYLTASDDVIEKGALECGVTHLEENARAKFLMGNAKTCSGNGVPGKLVYGDDHRKFMSMSDGEIRQAIFLDAPPLFLQATIFRTDTLRSIGGWNDSLVLDDYPTFIQLLMKYSGEGGEFIFAPNIVISDYRQHSNNSYRNLLRQVDMVEQVLEHHCPVDLLQTAKSLCYARYLFSALKKFDIAVSYHIFRRGFACSGSHFFWSIRRVLLRKLPF